MIEILHSHFGYCLGAAVCSSQAIGFRGLSMSFLLPLLISIRTLNCCLTPFHHCIIISFSSVTNEKSVKRYLSSLWLSCCMASGWGGHKTSKQKVASLQLQDTILTLWPYSKALTPDLGGKEALLGTRSYASESVCLINTGAFWLIMDFCSQ